MESSLRDELAELQAKIREQHEHYERLLRKVDQKDVQPVEKPLGKSKISINTVFNLNPKEGQVRQLKAFFGDLIKKNKIPPDTTYRSLGTVLAENWIEAVGINLYIFFISSINFICLGERSIRNKICL